MYCPHSLNSSTHKQPPVPPLKVCPDTLALHMAEQPAFVHPILEYSPLVWMGASATTLSPRDTAQCRGIHIFGPQYCLSSLSHCRNVAVLSCFFKLLCLPVPSPPHSVLLALDTVSILDIPATHAPTRHQQSRQY